MKKEYDFSNAKPNPYASQLKKTITIRIDEESISYFKELAEETGLPYQSLINLFLKDCAANKRKPDIKWNK
ncbi:MULTISPECIES: CopG family antitoxin [Snodgrassella]|uniref:Antitoxin n=1 Tax=Snodgrassella alvi TaxID=1196083 RepID=A0A2N9XXM3_9NEIS|nr:MULTISPECIES: CopG family antitoxin [Snodgrassella]MCX8748210.1 BrnA antitoxin family protein [Snodgrassella sp. B3088]NUE66982.1 BrnA antitoxin family protein [Snodgrassella sp. ESL0253]PIT38689.1 antitoxin [Snodgrassella alvi]PIT40811.1 antitoxin [Snodgrassella alvi]PIT52305.1 antitoxin [Snodgrassella alvi]